MFLNTVPAEQVPLGPRDLTPLITEALSEKQASLLY